MTKAQMKISHKNFLSEEELQKKDLYNLSRKQNLFFTIIDNPNVHQDDISSWHNFTIKPKQEPSNLTKPIIKNPKNKIFNKFDDNSNLNINYRYFNDWKSHSIYYKQIKGYSHNQDIAKICQSLNLPNEESQSDLAQIQRNIRLSGELFDKHSRLNELLNDNSRVYNTTSVADRTMERSFLVESQSGFFSKKNSTSLNNMSSTLSHIAAQNAPTVNFAHQRQNNLNNVLTSSQVSTKVELKPSGFNSSSVNSTLVGSNLNNYINSPSINSSTTSTNNKLESYISSRKVKNVDLKMQNVAQKIVDEIHNQKNTRKILPDIKKIKEKPGMNSQMLQQQHEQNFKSLSNQETKSSSENSKTKFDSSHNYLIKTSKSGRHIVSVKKESEYVIGQNTVSKKSPPSNTDSSSQIVDFYAKWSTLANKHNELKNIIPNASHKNDQHTPRTKISTSLVNKKFSNLINVQSRFRNDHNNKENQSKQYYSDSDLIATGLGESFDSSVLLKSDSKVRMARKKKISNMLTRSKDTIGSKSNTNLSTNSSSHFPKFIKESIKLKV